MGIMKLIITEEKTKTIGHMPLVRMNRISVGTRWHVVVKMESFNVLSSVKNGSAWP
jgi:cysteine synthase